MTDNKLASMDPEQVQAEDIRLDVRELDDATGDFLPLIAAGCLKELGLLGEEALWDVEAGGEPGLPFIDDDRNFFG